MSLKNKLEIDPEFLMKSKQIHLMINFLLKLLNLK